MATTEQQPRTCATCSHHDRRPAGHPDNPDRVRDYCTRHERERFDPITGEQYKAGAETCTKERQLGALFVWEALDALVFSALPFARQNVPCGRKGRHWTPKPEQPAVADAVALARAFGVGLGEALVGSSKLAPSAPTGSFGKPGGVVFVPAGSSVVRDPDTGKVEGLSDDDAEAQGTFYASYVRGVPRGTKQAPRAYVVPCKSGWDVREDVGNDGEPSRDVLLTHEATETEADNWAWGYNYGTGWRWIRGRGHVHTSEAVKCPQCRAVLDAPGDHPDLRVQSEITTQCRACSGLVRVRVLARYEVERVTEEAK